MANCVKLTFIAKQKKKRRVKISSWKATSLKKVMALEIEACKETLFSKNIDGSSMPIKSFQGWVTFVSGAIGEERK